MIPRAHTAEGQHERLVGLECELSAFGARCRRLVGDEPAALNAVSEAHQLPALPHADGIRELAVRRELHLYAIAGLEAGLGTNKVPTADQRGWVGVPSCREA